jgi:hypothetical protein
MQWTVLTEDDDAGGDEEQVGSWEIITDYETTIEIDSIDQYLLDAARTEIPIVLGRLKAKMFGGRSRNLNTIPASKFLQAWMDANFLGYIKQFVNKNLTGDPVSNSEILAFIQVELMLSFYRVSPSLYFDMDKRSNFPSAGQGMDLRQIQRDLGRSLQVWHFRPAIDAYLDTSYATRPRNGCCYGYCSDNRC